MRVSIRATLTRHSNEFEPSGCPCGDSTGETCTSFVEPPPFFHGMSRCAELGIDWSLTMAVDRFFSCLPGTALGSQRAIANSEMKKKGE
jgi:hypothetical protein